MAAKGTCLHPGSRMDRQVKSCTCILLCTVVFVGCSHPRPTATGGTEEKAEAVRRIANRFAALLTSPQEGLLLNKDVLAISAMVAQEMRDGRGDGLASLVLTNRALLGQQEYYDLWFPCVAEYFAKEMASCGGPSETARLALLRIVEGDDQTRNARVWSAMALRGTDPEKALSVLRVEYANFDVSYSSPYQGIAVCGPTLTTMGILVPTELATIECAVELLRTAGRSEPDYYTAARTANELNRMLHAALVRRDFAALAALREPKKLALALNGAYGRVAAAKDANGGIWDSDSRRGP